MKKQLHLQLAALAAALTAQFPSARVYNEINSAEVLAAIKAEVEKLSSDLKKQAENAIKELNNKGELSQETKLKVDTLMTEKNTLVEKNQEILNRLGALEQALSNGFDKKAASKILTLGNQVVTHEEFLAINGAENFGKNRVQMKVKKPMNVVTSDAGSGGALIDPMRIGVANGPARALRVRDLLVWGRTLSGSVEFPRETTWTNNANTVSENPALGKPESEIGWTLITETVRTIAHFIKASKQSLDDAPMLAALIDNRLMYGLAEKEEDQLMKGSGTGTEINGLFTQASTYAQPSGANVQAETRLDRLRLALLQVELADYQADGIVINPTDWAAIELLKDSQNQYLFANPHGMITPMLWGKRVVSSKSLSQSEFLVGAFQTAAMGFDREDANVTISNADGNDFTKNMITILAELRAVLTVFQTAAFVKGDFDGVQGS